MALTVVDYTDEYLKARKKGRQKYFASIAQGRSGFIPSLDGILQNATIVSEIDIGIFEIPLSKIVGTLSHSRALMFSEDFLPLAKTGTEFFRKWTALYSAHISEGIRDPIKVFEYLNWFYVMEGNKRVSVLKYVGAVSIHARVIRLLPKKNPLDQSIITYYDFIRFNRETTIFTIWIKKSEGFLQLLEMLKKHNPPLKTYTSKYRFFLNNVFLPFREIYKELGGDDCACTTGDAFLEFAKIYGIPNSVDAENYGKIIKGLILEMKASQENESFSVDAEPGEEARESIVSSIATMITQPKPLKVAFVHAKTPETSGWTWAHEEGRKYIKAKFEDRIETEAFFNVPETRDCISLISKIGKEFDVVFTTSPQFLQASLRAALVSPETRFFNCNRKRSYKHVRTYFGRSYEVRYLLGIIAGSITRENKIGVIASFSTPENRASVNAFALGAASVNPSAEIEVRWAEEWDDVEKSKNLAEELCSQGVDIISQNAMAPLNSPAELFGLYGFSSMKSCRAGEVIHYAQCVWNWGIFYKRILKNIFSSTLKTARSYFSGNETISNFWWGMDSRIVDISYTLENIPPQLLNLTEGIKKMIIQRDYSIFTGPIYDSKGNLRVEPEESITYEEMLDQDWLVMNIVNS